MTDVVALAKRQFDRIEWQNVPDTVTQNDLTAIIADAIRFLYVVTGRALEFSEGLFTMEEDIYISFGVELKPDEIEYVLVTAEIQFLQKVQSSVDDLTSYTTDAMAVSHGDKPFANLQQKIDEAKERQKIIWFKMIRFHLL